MQNRNPDPVGFAIGGIRQGAPPVVSPSQLSTVFTHPDRRVRNESAMELGAWCDVLEAWGFMYQFLVLFLRVLGLSRILRESFLTRGQAPAIRTVGRGPDEAVVCD